jgi:hypothetical protein
MQYHAFISHAQADASGTANALFMMHQQLGVRTWLDMRQSNLTLEGMRQGVIDSDVFMMILSEHSLVRWFCQQELLCAIEHGKTIQVVLEAEPRFFPFNLAAWHESKTAQERYIVISEVTEKVAVKVTRDEKDPWQQARTDEQLTELVCNAIDRSLPHAVTYRRREFEATAMMHELCRRNSLMLPPASVPAQRPAKPFKLSVICNSVTAESMHGEIMAEIQQWSHVDVVPLTAADRVLLLLSPRVLERGSSTLEQLQGAVVSSSDSSRALSRMVMVYDGATWDFGPNNAEISDAPEEVKACIQDHEAIAFRPRGPEAGPDNPNRHEFHTMMQWLRAQLEESSTASATAVYSEPEPEPEASQERHTTIEDELRDARAELARKDALIATLRQELSRVADSGAAASDEGVPPHQ